MGIVGVSVLVACVIACFAVIIFWAVAIQPRRERTRAEISPDEAWRASGFEQLRGNGFSLYQVVPTDQMRSAEFIIQDEYGRELGRYIGTKIGDKSAVLQYAGKKASLYIQGGLVGGSIYAGKVGGTSNDSIVIRDETHLIAECWRESVIPVIEYRLVYSGETFRIATGGLSPTALGTITQDGRQLAAFRRPSLSERNMLVAISSKMPDELKICFCSIILLQ